MTTESRHHDEVIRWSVGCREQPKPSARLPVTVSYESRFRSMINKKQPEQIDNPFLSQTNQQTFYPYPAWSQRLHMVTRLFGGPSRLLLILGEAGSGKTLLMKQFMAQEERYWKSCRINAHDVTDIPGDDHVRGMKAHRAYMHTKNQWPVVMMDDAHTLTAPELSFLIRLTGLKGYQRQIDKLVFFGTPAILTHVSELSGLIPEAGAVEKVFMPRLTLAETQAYVTRRLASAGYQGTTFFTASDLDHIYEESGGCPGGINASAARLFNQKSRDESRLKTFFKQFFS